MSTQALSFFFFFFLCLQRTLAGDFLWPTRFQAKFEQTFEKSLQQQQKISHGLIAYETPLKLKLDIQEPEADRMTYIAHGDDTWKYTPSFDGKEKGQVIFRKSVPHPIIVLFEKLQTHPGGGKGYRVEKKVSLIIVHLEKNTLSDMKVSRVEFSFKGSPIKDFSSLERISFFEKKKLVSTLRLSEMNQNPSFAEDYFRWVPREDVTLIAQ